MDLSKIKTLTAAQPGTLAVFACQGQQDVTHPVRFFAIREDVNDDGHTFLRLSPVVQDHNLQLAFAEDWFLAGGMTAHEFAFVKYP